MSVTQNYTIIMSSDAWLAVVAAVLSSVRDDRRELDRMPLMPGWAEWINSEIKLKSEAIGALNLATILAREETHGALEGENLRTAIEAMHFMLLCWGVMGQGGSLTEAVRDARYNPRGKVMPSADDLNAALLFLESPK